MNEEVNSIKEQITAGKTQHKALTTTLNTLQSTLTTDDLRKAVLEAETTREELQGRIMTLRSGSVSAISVEEKQKVEESRRRHQRELNLRKRIFKDFWDMLCDNLPEGIDKDDIWVRWKT